MENPSPRKAFWIKLHGRELDLFCNPLEHLASSAWHEVGSVGAFDLERMIEENKEIFVHSSQTHDPQDGESFKWEWQKLYFRPSNDRFVTLQIWSKNRGNLSVWAISADDAKREFLAWWDKYRIKKQHKRKPTEFYLLTFEGGVTDTERVTVLKTYLNREQEMALHYGEDFPEWASQFTRWLKNHDCGTTILRGEPGTGKTSFLRHLIYKLRRTHRFYYLPTDYSDLITSPKMTAFWARENYKHAGLKKVIILEDAESLLMQRGGNNRAILSNMLNVTDGLLGEFLKLHLICTINCEVEKLDPAVIRSGRLLDYRQFRRLTAEESCKLAEFKGIRLSGDQRDYSLAEIYNGPCRMAGANGGKQLGFAIS